MGEMKEGNLLFSFYSIFKFLPCISPISFLVFLRMKGMNLPFAAIRPIQIGEMEEMEEIGECYRGSLLFFFLLIQIHSSFPPFPFYYLAKRKEEDTNMKEKDETKKEDATKEEETNVMERMVRKTHLLYYF